MRRSFPAGALVLLLAVGSAIAQTASPAPTRGSAMQEALLQPFKGDWDAIKKRGVLRALVVYSRTLYFVDKGQQRGATYEVLKAFQDQLNTQLKTKVFRFQVVFVPMSRDELIPALLDGRGDIVAANLTITPERERLVDFSIPVLENVTEVVVTGPSGPKISSLEDLAGKTVHVRRSSSYWEHLDALSKRLVQAGKPPIKLVPVSEDLEDEDLLEMANAGLIPIVVCDAFILHFWKSVYTKLSAEPEVALS
ncbi:MAG: transporter substrate-binding domain-containing protein, partial [Myxococcaceae bacterium]